MKNIFYLLIIPVLILILGSCKTDILPIGVGEDIEVQQRDDDDWAQSCSYDGDSIWVNPDKLIKPASLTGVGWGKLATNWNYDTVYLEWGDYTSYGTLDLSVVGNNTRVIYGLFYPLDPNLPAHGPAIVDGVLAGYGNTNEITSITFVNIKFTDNIAVEYSSIIEGFSFVGTLCCEFDNCSANMDAASDQFGQEYYSFSSAYIGDNAGIDGGYLIINNCLFEGCDTAIAVKTWGSGLVSSMVSSKQTLDSCVFIGTGVDTSYSDIGITYGLSSSSSGTPTTDMGVTNSTFIDHYTSIDLHNTWIRPSLVLYNNVFIKNNFTPSHDYTFVDYYANNGNWPEYSSVDCSYLNNNDKAPIYVYINSSNPGWYDADHTSNFHDDCDSGVYSNVACSNNTHRSSNTNCNSTPAGSAQTVTYHTNTTLLNWATNSYTSN